MSGMTAVKTMANAKRRSVRPTIAIASFYRHLRHSDNTRPSESHRLPSELMAAAAQMAASAARGLASGPFTGVMMTSRTASARSHADQDLSVWRVRKIASSEKHPKATGPSVSLDVSRSEEHTSELQSR